MTADDDVDVLVAVLPRRHAGERHAGERHDATRSRDVTSADCGSIGQSRASAAIEPEAPMRDWAPGNLQYV